MGKRSGAHMSKKKKADADPSQGRISLGGGAPSVQPAAVASGTNSATKRKSLPDDQAAKKAKGPGQNSKGNKRGTKEAGSNVKGATKIKVNQAASGKCAPAVPPLRACVGQAFTSHAAASCRARARCRWVKWGGWGCRSGCAFLKPLTPARARPCVCVCVCVGGAARAGAYEFTEVRPQEMTCPGQRAAANQFERPARGHGRVQGGHPLPCLRKVGADAEECQHPGAGHLLLIMQ